MFSIQSGSPFSLKKKMISDTFSHFGVIAFVFYQTGSSFGFVNFQSSEDAKNVFNKVGALPDLDQVEEPSFLLGEVHHHQGVCRGQCEWRPEGGGQRQGLFGGNEDPVRRA